MRAIADIPGKPFLRDMGAKGKYWYARQRIGNKTIQKYVGPDTPEIRERIEVAKAASEESQAFNQRCSSMVAQLRAAGVPALDRDTGKVMNAMTRSGVFRLGGTLVGTHAFRLYSAELGVRFDEMLGVTSDVDIAAFENLKLVIEDEVDPTLPDAFKDLNLRPAPGLDRKNRPTKWVMGGGGTEVEFLVPLMRQDSDILKLEPLGVYAQALPFLNFLIADPIPAVALYRSGVLVQIPRPERYAVHKLIVASRRHSSSALKAKKDLAQAEILFEVLSEDRPAELSNALTTSLETGPKWREAIAASLSKSERLRTLARHLN
ncbi:MAG: GSU2403 family nucleotidyltransferase fold protein [Hyphomonadaceae bacterium]